MSIKLLKKQRLIRRQEGMTTLGVIILVAFVGIFAFAAIRLIPVYLNYMKVAQVVAGVTEEFDGAGASSSMIRSSISRRFDVEMISEIRAKDVTVKKVDGGYEVTAAYSHKAPFVANVSFVVDFDTKSMVRK